MPLTLGLVLHAPGLAHTDGISLEHIWQDNLDLVDLPDSYTELYGMAKSPHASAAAAAEGIAGHETDPAVCLVCGQVRVRLLR